MTFLGNFPEDHAAVVCMFTTHASDGSPVAPSTGFEAEDVLIYKDGGSTQKTTANGVTMTSPFDTITGLHCVSIDTANDTGDSGFWESGSTYTLVLSPDETVDSISVVSVIGQFTLGMVGQDLNSTTFAEPGQEAPSATTSLAKKIGYLYKAWRNKHTQTNTTYSLYADDGTTVDQTTTVTDDGTTFTRSEIGTGA